MSGHIANGITYILLSLQPQDFDETQEQFWSNFGAIISIKIHKFDKNRIKMI